MKKNLLWLLALSASACQEKPIDMTPNNLPTAELQMDQAMDQTMDPNADQNMTDMQMQAETCDTCLQPGSWYRFNELKITAINQKPNSPVINILNPLWKRDIENQFLNVMFQIDRVENGQIMIRAMNAALSNPETGEYCLLDTGSKIDTSTTFTFDQSGCDFTPTTPSGINIYAGSVDIPKNCAVNLPTKHSIPVRNVMLSGSFSEGCSKLINGKVSNAGIPGDELSGVCTCLSPGSVDNCGTIDPAYVGNNGKCAGCGSAYTSLGDQLMLLREAPISACPVDGKDAVCIDASFSADRLDFTPSICPN